MKPPTISTKLWTNTQVEPGLPALDRIAGRDRDRQHDHEHDDEHVRHADARRQRADVGAAGLLREPVGEPRVVHRATGTSSARPPGRMRPNTRSSGIFSTKRSRPGQHQQVDEDVGAEAEERVPVARRPQRGLARGHRHPLASGSLRCAGTASGRQRGQDALRVRDPAEDAALRLDHRAGRRRGTRGSRRRSSRRARCSVAAVVGLAHGRVHADLGGHAARRSACRCRGCAGSRAGRSRRTRPCPACRSTGSPGERRERRDDVVARLAAHQDAAHRARGRRCAAAARRARPWPAARRTGRADGPRACG